MRLLSHLCKPLGLVSQGPFRVAITGVLPLDYSESNEPLGRLLLRSRCPKWKPSAQALRSLRLSGECV